MERQFEYFRQRLQRVPLTHNRPLLHELPPAERLIGIKGARGVGKTTLLLQYAHHYLPTDQKTLYISLDDPFFQQQTLEEFARSFVQLGGSALLIDEVHRLPDWGRSLKFLYDQYPELRIIFTASSVLQLNEKAADLGRRGIFRELPGLSFREYLNWFHAQNIPVLPLYQLGQQHATRAAELSSQFKPLALFKQYLEQGYYPFQIENPATYLEKLRENTRITIESDIRTYMSIETDTIHLLLKLMAILADSVPFTPNISKLAERMGSTRNTVVMLLEYLEKGKLIHRLYKQSSGITRMQKPDKIYLDNPNLMFALSWNQINWGALCETFAVSQLRPVYPIRLGQTADFLVDETYELEIGGRQKGGRQLQQSENSFLLTDDTEIGFGRKIPLWMLGLIR
jgi:uncharacterized protein